MLNQLEKMQPNFAKTKEEEKSICKTGGGGNQIRKCHLILQKQKRIREPKIICKKGGEGGAKIRKCHRILQQQEQQWHCKE